MYAEGKKKKEIARLFDLSPKTVRRILNPGNHLKERPDKKNIDEELLRKVYVQCKGFAQRIHEVLTEEHGIEIGYSTLTRMIRQLGIGQKNAKRCGHFGDIPGQEMQHDTTTYKVKMGDKIKKVVCSGLYLRYSKVRFIKFYQNFNRFKLKCFLHEALMYWGYTAGRCVVDNSNLAVHYGTGKDAVFNQEMVRFARKYGFEWLAHEKNHSNRKAGIERNFFTVETNFLPGRTFNSFTDLNRQAFEWATNRYANRPMSKTRLIPVMLFEEEKADLMKLSEYIEPPYQPHKRNIDAYGYIAFDANYYWIPGKKKGKVSVIEYPDKIKVFVPEQSSIEYKLPDIELSNEKFTPTGVNPSPYSPKQLTKPCHEEEKRLRGLGEFCCEYLDFIRSKDSMVKQKPKFIRQLYALSRKMSPELFELIIRRALKYHVTNIEALVSISHQQMKKEQYSCDEITLDSNEYENRPAYQEGRFSQERDLKYYQDLFEGNEDEE